MILPPTSSSLNIATLSDVHLGHRRTKAVEIIKNLKRDLGDDSFMVWLDVLFIAGDLYDRILSLPDEDVNVIDNFLIWLLFRCSAFGVTLRVVEGTHRHDWRQPRRLMMLKESLKVEVDVEYFPALTIEYMEKFDINVLYIPDEWLNDTTLALAEAQELMKAKGLDKVDIAIMHGQFKHQLPEEAHAPVHDTDAYLEMVRYMIFIGHVHTHSVYLRIIAQGSYDRIAFGEPKPKGFVKASLYPDGSYQAAFVENVNAKRYDTVNVEGMELEAALTKVRTHAAAMPDFSFMQIAAEKGHPILAYSGINLEFALLTISNKEIKDKSETINTDQAVPVEAFDYTPIVITPDNTEALLLPRLASKNLTGDLLALASTLLRKVL